MGEICVSKCGINQVWNRVGCDCIFGNARINGVCRPCPSNSVINQNKDSCICPTGTIFDNQSVNCVNIQCLLGTLYNSTSKACESICKINEVYNSSDCVCNKGFYKINGICGQCASGTGYQLASLSCVACGINQISINSLCFCKEGANLINGTCTTYPINQNLVSESQNYRPNCGLN